jgi:hypothetical protein
VLSFDPLFKQSLHATLRPVFDEFGKRYYLYFYSKEFRENNSRGLYFLGSIQTVGQGNPILKIAIPVPNS